ncbi:exopolysaccharide transport protein family protein [alpha proteobacterium Q-1]|nr:exopolysaccharide transport protein family protein [alpha proteobacterium Q-1]
MTEMQDKGANTTGGSTQSLVATTRAASHGQPREVYLHDMVAALRRHFWLIVMILSVSTGLGLAYAIFAKPLYTATVTTQPASTEQGGALSGLGGSLGGAAALAGISLGDSDGDQVAHMAVLKSYEFSMRFLENNKMRPDLFPEQWNAETGDWRQGDPGVIGRLIAWLSALIARLSGDEGWVPPSHIPSDWEAFDLFSSEIRHIREDTDNGLVTVSFRFRDPQKAALWANEFVAQANAEIRSRTVAEAARAMTFLKDEAENTRVAGLQATIYGLMQAQLEKAMMANSRPEYAFRVIDRATVPQVRSHPQRSLIVFLSLFLGLALGVGVALSIEFWRGTLVREQG